MSVYLHYTGVQIPSTMYAWLAVFVLPVNSALNPILYTMTTKLFKQQVSHCYQQHPPVARTHTANWISGLFSDWNQAICQSPLTHYV